MCGKDVTRKLFLYVTEQKYCVALQWNTALHATFSRAAFENDDGTCAPRPDNFRCISFIEMPTRYLIQSAEIQSAAIRDVESA
jgi:hypothetical protein